MALTPKVEGAPAGSELGREGAEEEAGAAAFGTSLEGALVEESQKVEDLGWKRSARAAAERLAAADAAQV